MCVFVYVSDARNRMPYATLRVDCTESFLGSTVLYCYVTHTLHTQDETEETASSFTYQHRWIQEESEVCNCISVCVQNHFCKSVTIKCVLTFVITGMCKSVNIVILVPLYLD